MPRRRNAPKNQTDLMTLLSTGLRQVAFRPTIYGYTPMPKQEIFHSSPAKGRLFLGGNRGGKTTAGGSEMVMWATGKHRFRKVPDPPTRLRCVSVDFLNGVEKIIKPELARWSPSSELLGGSWETAWNSELRTLYFENGSFIECMSYDQDIEKFAGTSRHAIWFDEEPPNGIYTECMMRLIDTGGHWWITMTPVEGMSWTYDALYVESKVNAEIDVIVTSIYENVYLNQGDIEVATQGLSADEKKARSLGQYVAIGGLIYRMFDGHHVIDPIIGGPLWKNFKKDWLHVCCMDHGYNNPTAWLWLAIDSDGRIIVYDEHYLSGEVVRTHAKTVHDKSRAIGIQPSYYVGDPSIRNTDPITGTSVHLEYMECDIPIILGNNDVHIGINRVAWMLENDLLYITRNCINLIKEFSKYRWSRWASQRMREDRNKKEEPHKKDDHALDALRYGVVSRLTMEHDVPTPRQAPEGYPIAFNQRNPLYDPDVLKIPAFAEKKVHDSFELGEEW